MQKIVLIGLAGLAGTLCRYWMSGALAQRYGEIFPLGTLLVNVVGCFLAGFLFHLLHERLLVSSTLQAVVFIGFLGGLTTFSSFGLQTFSLLRDGALGLAALNVVISNLVGLLMVWVGYSLARSI